MMNCVHVVTLTKIDLAFCDTSDCVTWEINENSVLVSDFTSWGEVRGVAQGAEFYRG